ncbi:porin [Bradyrhizobium sp. LTSP885]|uniref:carbohydrate porin n=1 Tax=Bradyrhizobium sp. LTSP885 TaxID=1619232 RepID=UPI0005CB31C3|nr:carbohydrate porin [Bradyrhizobium sp. LTSP885]KJC48690.1 porin [Bradyrhizobium sp. LTSP885]
MVRIYCVVGCLAAFTAAKAANAADLPKAAIGPGTPFDWSGWYVGGHVGYAAGQSDWSADPAGGIPSSGTTVLTNGFDLFKGSGSFFGGFQGGANLTLPSRVLLGFETDVSFPNLIAGTTSTGTVSYGDTQLYSGTVRGRLGYVFDNNWLAYGTGGFAWSYDQLSRTQLAGGVLPSDTNEGAFLWRFGWAAGAGVEIPVAPNWSARGEYLYTGFGRNSRAFAGTQELFNSDMSLHQVRFGLNYRLFGDDAVTNPALVTKVPAAATEDIWAVHGQTTFVRQYAAPFRAPYSGPNSLAANAGRETWDATAYVGLRLWKGAEAWFNPEIDQGYGLSGTLGVAGFTSGEAYKKGADYPYTRLHRAFIRQTIDLGGETQTVDAGINQFAATQTADRLVFTVGKFGVGDVFDTNKYAHDPRSDFLNWSIIGAGTFDYAAEAWGYSLGGAVEWYQGDWAFRGGLFDMSIVPNSTDLDPQFGQFQWIGEIEHRHELWGQPGKIAVTGFLSRGRMGTFQDALALAASTGDPINISAVREYRSRGGVSLNVEQQIADGVGLFGRAGWANGDVEPYEFTDIDRTVSAGLSVQGKRWGRPDDTFGIAGVINGISKVHQEYLNAGGLGILVGDGQLPHPGSEQILETYYSFPVSFARVTLDYQLIVNPGYNRDRGPVSVFATRLHTQF